MLPPHEQLRFWEWMAIVAFLVGVAAIAIYAAGASFARIFSMFLLVGIAAWLAGGVLGFLFGVPRFQSSPGGGAAGLASSFIPNTNLEQVSDWLTKIIIGATLTVRSRPNANAARSVTELHPIYRR